MVSPRPATLFGSGRVESIGQLVRELEVEVAVVDGKLSPVQQRNLERAWDCKVIDRTGLILEIFGARARTREGKTAGRPCGNGISAQSIGEVMDPS